MVIPSFAVSRGMTRKSLACYYFTNGRPAEEVTGTLNAVQARKRTDFQPCTTDAGFRGYTAADHLRNIGKLR